MLKCTLNICYNPREWFLKIIFAHGFGIYTRGFASMIAFDIMDCCDNG